MRPITKIIIQRVAIKDLDALIVEHIDEKNMPEVGFHYMIKTDGEIKTGRSISILGNHYIGENSSSIGIATIGNKLSKKQESAIDTLLRELELKAPNVKEVFIVENGELKMYK